MDELGIQKRATFHVADYVIFGLTVAISSCIGIYFALSGGRQKTTSEYFVGNRKMKVAPVALSFLVSFESSIMMLGIPAEIYAYGTQYWMCHFGLCLALVIAAQIAVPLFYSLNVTSAYEYLELRFNSRAVRLVGSFLGILNQTVYMGIVLFGPATALESVTGFNVVYSIVLVAIAALFYTALGGIKAVVWTDVLQFFIMTGGMLAVIIAVCIHVGGFSQMWNLNKEGGRVKFLDFDPSPFTRNTFWTLIVGNAIRYLFIGFNQTTVQRVVSMETLKGAKLMVLLALPGFFFLGTIACLDGMVAYAYLVYTECDPYEAKIINNSNQVLPYVVMELFRNLPGLPGLFLASLFSATLSTLSSSLTSISAIIWTDFLKPCMRETSEAKAAVIAKMSVVLFGAVSIGIAFLIKAIGGPLNQIGGSVMGSITGPLTGMFLVGCLCPFVNGLGVAVGSLSSLLLCMWLSLGSSFSPYASRTPYLPPGPVENCYLNGTFNVSDISTEAPSTNVTIEEPSGFALLYSISYHYIGPIGIITCGVLAMLISAVSGGWDASDQVDPIYISRVCDNLCCCLPGWCRRKVRYKGHQKQIRKGHREQIDGVNKCTETLM